VLEKDQVAEIIKKFGKHAKDSGAAETQIALLSKRISVLTGHVDTHDKDYSSRRGLLQLVSQRRQLLSYVRRKNEDRYQKIVKELGLRK